MDKTGKCQYTEIVTTMEKAGLDTTKPCFQSYDFVSPMSSQFNGAQRILPDIKKKKKKKKSASPHLGQEHHSEVIQPYSLSKNVPSQI